MASGGPPYATHAYPMVSEPVVGRPAAGAADMSDPLAPLPPLPPSRARAFSPEVSGGSHSAQAVLGEVSMLEAALRDASIRKRGNAVEESSTRYDSAVTMYSVQLKAWIDLQVDQRLSQVLEGELQLIRKEAANAIAVGSRAEVEVRSITEAQTKLLAVVEGISEEIGRLKAAVAACQLSAQLHTAASSASHHNEDTVLAVEKATIALEELRHSVNAIQAQDNATAAELGRHEVAIAELRRLQDHHFQRYGGEITEATGALKGTKREVNELVGLVQRLENRFAAWRSEVADELRGVDQRRRAELTAHGDLETRLAEELSTLQRRLATELRSEISASLHKDGLTQGELHSALEESKRDMKRLISEAQGHSEVELREIARSQNRQISDLRAEITAAFKSEASAVAALDEQIWLTDQRLGQRIDELVHQVAPSERAGRKVVMERMGPSYESRPTQAQAPTHAGGALAMAKVAGDALMQACDVPPRHTSSGLTKVSSEASFHDDRPRSAFRAASLSAQPATRRQSALSMARVAGEALMESGDGHLEERRTLGGPGYGLRPLDRDRE
mmetsp:Transcript_9105/g.20251  ORF Transcript_9105/g.20251 Transcript_9105/m.20251 type:complete len:562 (+) Transcript_9105:52-1737(+)